MISSPALYFFSRPKMASDTRPKSSSLISENIGTLRSQVEIAIRSLYSGSWNTSTSETPSVSSRKSPREMERQVTSVSATTFAARLLSARCSASSPK